MMHAIVELEVADRELGMIDVMGKRVELGLVDALGGFHEALRLAKEEAGIDPDREVGLRLYPRPKTTLELFLEGWSEIGTPRRTSQTLLDLQAGVRELRRITLGPPYHGVLSTPPVEPAP